MPPASDDQPVIKLTKLSDYDISTMKEEIKASPEMIDGKPLTRNSPVSVSDQVPAHNVPTSRPEEALDSVPHMDIKMLSSREISSLRSSLKRSHADARKKTSEAAGSGDKCKTSPKERSKSASKSSREVDGVSPKRTEWNCPLCKAHFANSSLLGAHLNKKHLKTKVGINYNGFVFCSTGTWPPSPLFPRCLYVRYAMPISTRSPRSARI